MDGAAPGREKQRGRQRDPDSPDDPARRRARRGQPLAGVHRRGAGVRPGLERDRGDARRHRGAAPRGRVDDRARPAGRARRGGRRGARPDPEGAAGRGAEPARPVQSVLVPVRAARAAAGHRRLHRAALRPAARSRGGNHRRAGSERGHGGGLLRPLRAGRRRGGDAALSRALSVAGGDLRARAAVRDAARGPRRRHVAARPRRGARRRRRPVGRGRSS